MIADKIENIASYKTCCKHMEKAIIFLNSTTNWVVGRVELGEGAYAFVSEYDTKEEGDILFETHEKYIDVQYVVEGEEEMGWLHKRALEETIPYSEDKDITFFKAMGNYTKILVTKGVFVVFFPQDGHKPCIRGKSKQAKKVVVKLPIEVGGN